LYVSRYIDNSAGIGRGMALLALSLNHHHAPLALRGRLAVAADRLAPALAGLRQCLGAAHEAALLSTCNRTELYLATPGDPAALARPALGWLAAQGGLPATALEPHATVAQADEATRHVFRVASGLESMVLGEPQILGQIKVAAREAGAAGTLGSTLHQLFQRSFAVAKEVRSRTEIGAHSVSLAAAAVRLADELFGQTRELDVLFVGAGEMIELAATHFASRKPRSMTIANRRPERAAALGDRLGAQLMLLSELPSQLHRFDVIVSCTASPVPLIGLGAVERALKARRRRPMLLVDLAVPRDIEPEVAQLADAYLYTLDELAQRVRVAGDRRQAAVAQAEAIVDAGVQGFAQWCRQRGNVPLIRELHRQADAWQHAELRRASRALARGEAMDQVLQGLASGLAHKMMHGTLRALQDSADGDERELLAQAAGRLWLQRPG
jgi:glutamyl-tRNA reductase